MEGHYLSNSKSFTTKALHAGEDNGNSNNKPAFPFHHNQIDPALFNYKENVTLQNVAQISMKQLAALENAKHCLIFPSGLGAETNLFSILKSGDHIVCGDDIYGANFSLLKEVVVHHGITTTFVDACDAAKVAAAVTPQTKLIWIETPTNPTLKVINIEDIAKITKENDILLVVDNTFLTPFFQRPLEFGADVVIYSLTKFMNGHSDVLMGALVLNNDELYEKLELNQIARGSFPTSFDCLQLHEGLKTLALRMRQHSLNGLHIAQFLEQHPKVSKVLYPGLPSHPQHELFVQQTSGNGGMVSFYIRNGRLEETDAFLRALKIFVVAQSLGGFESLAEAPSVMTHVSLTDQQREILNITDNLIRLSVGIEDEEDLIEDLKRALDAVTGMKSGMLAQFYALNNILS